MKSRWDPCVTHRGEGFRHFVQQHFVEPRKVLFIGGAGFDPRSTSILSLLTSASNVPVHALLVVESRLPADAELLRRAEENMATLSAMAESVERLDVPIFAADLAPIGGQQIVERLRQVSIGSFTDVLIDISALSVGISFPTVKYLLQAASSIENTVNVHLAVIDAPSVDLRIRSIASDRPTTIHGFKGGFGLEDNRSAVRLWMPQLMAGKAAVLRQIHSQIQPHDVLPIIPFPADELGWEMSFSKNITSCLRANGVSTHGTSFTRKSTTRWICIGRSCKLQTRARRCFVESVARSRFSRRRGQRCWRSER